MANIFIVDDDSYIRELTSLVLHREGFHIFEASDGYEALTLIESVKPDLVVLDIMMPNMDGWELCRQLRQFDSTLPILMLTAKGETSQKLKGFQLGTDDYLTKPFETAELVARVKALLKRYQIVFSQVIQVGKIQLNRKTYEAQLAGDHLILPLKEFELLFMLASYPNQTLPRDRLIEQIWGYDYEGDERTVDVHIKRLRSRFPEENSGFKITTVRGLGYRLEEKQ
ncbi:DNA-binding response regulator, OmpR family, contains REC and winged-helix (wHTH) domain [Seinonella peptonophila]|uniref:Heme response regulator HssR n=1 Tax=Seinonella peptonophila TaxID=112248 RepID=A0A1M4XN34_9BACL|nr:response regulator transcription factor [Seinonella peptonophila]SHE94858.1 DNA-binding response regulator, OmpR family, contains REC and winged-helix (wHTH) domain [Seinonella peptonophila]